MSPTRLLGTYLLLERASRQRNRPLVASRMLVLAAVVAARMRLDLIPEYLRHLLLRDNPHHLLGRLATIDEALEDESFLHNLRSLQRRYPLERAEQLLEQLGVAPPEDSPLISDEHYAAELLETTLDDIRETLEE